MVRLLISLLPPATKLGQGYVFTGVCDSVNRGGTSSPWEQTPPGSRHPPGADPPGADPPGSRPPWEQTPLGADTPRSRHPPPSEHAVRYGQRAGGTHPTGMQSCHWFSVCISQAGHTNRKQMALNYYSKL